MNWNWILWTTICDNSFVYFFQQIIKLNSMAKELWGQQTWAPSTGRKYAGNIHTNTECAQVHLRSFTILQHIFTVFIPFDTIPNEIQTDFNFNFNFYLSSLQLFVYPQKWMKWASWNYGPNCLLQQFCIRNINQLARDWVDFIIILLF